jgi:hypothetical protein
MDVCRSLETFLGCGRGSSLPPGWRLDAVLSRYLTVDHVVASVRILDHRSDELLGALVRRARSDERAGAVAVVALLPLVLARCSKGREEVDELIGELAIVIAETAEGRSPPLDCQAANHLLDRAWARLQRRTRRTGPLVCDPQALGRRLADHGVDPADLAADRVDLDRAIRWLSSGESVHGATVRAWSTVVALTGVEERSPAARSRLKYARRVLRRSGLAALVA